MSSDRDKRARVGKPIEIERHYRFADLQRLGVCPDWKTLYSWIERRDFPAGIQISRKMRIWAASEVQRWLDEQASRAA